MNDLPAVRWFLRLLVNPGWAPLGVVVMHLALAHYGLTHRFDHLLHFLGGASIAYFLFGLLASLPSLFASIPGWVHYLLVFTTACTVAGRHFPQEVVVPVPGTVPLAFGRADAAAFELVAEGLTVVDPPAAHGDVPRGFETA